MSGLVPAGRGTMPSARALDEGKIVIASEYGGHGEFVRPLHGLAGNGWHLVTWMLL